MARQLNTAPDRAYSFVMGALAVIGLSILVVPVLIVLGISFTSSNVIKFPPPGLSFRWYEALLDPVRSRHVHVALWNSLWVAAFATAIGAVLATLAALALNRASRASARAVEAGFLSPLILPGLAFGLATLMYFSILGFRPSLNLLIAGHIVVIAPFIFRTTLASLTQLDPALHESSASLGQDGSTLSGASPCRSSLRASQRARSSRSCRRWITCPSRSSSPTRAPICCPSACGE